MGTFDLHAIVLVTCGAEPEARGIARALVDARLAAGVQVIPIDSVYRWEGEVVEDQEWLLIAKTRRDRFDEIEGLVTGLHSYAVPPVLMLGIDRAAAPYLRWIDDSVTGRPETGDG